MLQNMKVGWCSWIIQLSNFLSKVSLVFPDDLHTFMLLIKKLKLIIIQLSRSCIPRAKIKKFTPIQTKQLRFCSSQSSLSQRKLSTSRWALLGEKTRSSTPSGHSHPGSRRTLAWPLSGCLWPRPLGRSVSRTWTYLSSPSSPSLRFPPYPSQIPPWRPTSPWRGSWRGQRPCRNNMLRTCLNLCETLLVTFT